MDGACAVEPAAAGSRRRKKHSSKARAGREKDHCCCAADYWDGALGRREEKKSPRGASRAKATPPRPRGKPRAATCDGNPDNCSPQLAPAPQLPSRSTQPAELVGSSTTSWIVVASDTLEQCNDAQSTRPPAFEAADDHPSGKSGDEMPPVDEETCGTPLHPENAGDLSPIRAVLELFADEDGEAGALGGQGGPASGGGSGGAPSGRGSYGLNEGAFAALKREGGYEPSKPGEEEPAVGSAVGDGGRSGKASSSHFEQDPDAAVSAAGPSMPGVEVFAARSSVATDVNSAQAGPKGEDSVSVVPSRRDSAAGPHADSSDAEDKVSPPRRTSETPGSKTPASGGSSHSHDVMPLRPCSDSSPAGISLRAAHPRVSAFGGIPGASPPSKGGSAAGEPSQSAHNRAARSLVPSPMGVGEDGVTADGVDDDDDDGGGDGGGDLGEVKRNLAFAPPALAFAAQVAGGASERLGSPSLPGGRQPSPSTSAAVDPPPYSSPWFGGSRLRLPTRSECDLYGSVTPPPGHGSRRVSTAGASEAAASSRSEAFRNSSQEPSPAHRGPVRLDFPEDRFDAFKKQISKQLLTQERDSLARELSWTRKTNELLEATLRNVS
ncbi:hypothetical protein DIPPA_19030 [Diplonema papillatum]|nr:hypothetical protein DIPPA_19030 [Diplonema papillatum]